MKFSLAKKRVGAYFNDGEYVCAVQVAEEHEDDPSPRLIEAIKAAKTEFLRVYQGGRTHAEGRIGD